MWGGAMRCLPTEPPYVSMRVRRDSPQPSEPPYQTSTLDTAPSVNFTRPNEVSFDA